MGTKRCYIIYFKSQLHITHPNNHIKLNATSIMPSNTALRAFYAFPEALDPTFVSTLPFRLEPSAELCTGV